MALKTINLFTTKATPAAGDFIHVWDTVLGQDRKTPFSAFGGSGLSSLWLPIPAGSWYLDPTNPAPLDQDSGSNGVIWRNRFDDTTEEFLLNQLPLPPSLDGSGTLYLYLWFYAVTWVASKNVKIKLYVSKAGDGATWDAAFSYTKVSGDIALSSAQDFLTIFNLSDTITNLGLSSLDQIRIKVSRLVAGANNLVGDLGIANSGILIPRA